MIVSVSAFRHDPHEHALERSSGTGGFALFAQATLPVYEDLNHPEARAAFGLDGQVMRNVSVVGMRVRDGDDASCLNLNRAQQPRVLAVRPEELQQRRAFAGEWRLLDQPQADGAVPAIGDEATVRWALGKKVGDTIAYVDERGNTFQLRIVAIIPNSILQGSLVISESNFIERFPSSREGTACCWLMRRRRTRLPSRTSFPGRCAIEGWRSFQRGGGLRIFRKSKTHTSQSSKRSAVLACCLEASASASWCCAMCWNGAANWRSSKLWDFDAVNCSAWC